MLHPNYVVAKVLMEERVAERLHEAETYRLLRQIRARRSSWLFRQGCWLLAQSGHLLVTLGQRLQQYDSAQPVSLEPAEVLGRE
jgi:hypothetical protein